MKWMQKTICTLLAGLCLVPAASAAGTGHLSPAGAKAYLDILEAAQARLGIAWITQDQTALNGLYSGLAAARLVDFDGDGIPELYLCASDHPDMPLKQYVYAWDGTKTIDLQAPESVSNFGTDLSPEYRIYEDTQKAYLVDGHEVMNGGVVTYYSKKGDKLQAALRYTDAEAENPDGTWGAHSCTLDGKPVSYEELSQTLQAFTAGMETYEQSFWWTVGEYNDPEPVILETIRQLKEVAQPAATVSTAKVTCNGNPVKLDAYTIAGNNYFKLRDLAAALNGSPKQFDVAWNSSQNRIDLTSGKAYSGTQPIASLLTNQPATPADSAVWLNGNALSLNAYTISGYTYFKLRDLGKAMDFAVDWENGTVTLDTSKPYRE